MIEAHAESGGGGRRAADCPPEGVRGFNRLSTPPNPASGSSSSPGCLGNPSTSWSFGPTLAKTILPPAALTLLFKRPIAHGRRWTGFARRRSRARSSCAHVAQDRKAPRERLESFDRR